MLTEECCCWAANGTLGNIEDGDPTGEDFASSESTCRSKIVIDTGTINLATSRVQQGFHGNCGFVKTVITNYDASQLHHGLQGPECGP